MTESLQRSRVGQTATGEATNQIIGKVTVTSGAYTLPASVAGKTVAEVRKKLSDPLNIDPQARALINGKEVGEDAVLKENDRLEFVRHSGEKG